jgi:hypothetical protein
MGMVIMGDSATPIEVGESEDEEGGMGGRVERVAANI